MAQVVEHLPRKLKALRLNPRAPKQENQDTGKKKKEKKNN
jgi:hypothetical protein